MYNNVPKNPEYLMAHYNNKRVKFSQDSMCGDIDGHGGGVCGVCTPPLKPKITRHTPLPKAEGVCTLWCRTRRVKKNFTPWCRRREKKFQCREAALKFF